MKELNHLADIFENYDTFIIDLWGVMHDGIRLNSSATNAVTKLVENGKKVIYVYGGMKGHSPKESVNLFVPILEKEGASVKIFDNFSVYEDEKLMNEADLIIQIFTDAFTSDPRMNNDQFKGLRNALINGTGFAGWHGGLGDSSPNPLYHFIVGGDFVAHPGELKEMKTAEYEVKIYDSEDYITNGISDLSLIHI